MPQPGGHEVTLTIPQEINILNTDLVLVVKKDGAKLGELRISRGSADWWPSGNRTNYHPVQWERFRDLLEAEPSRPKD
jgi:hypothetical protein